MPFIQNSPFAESGMRPASNGDVVSGASPFQVSPIYGILAAIMKQAMQYDPKFVRPPVHEWGGNQVGQGPISQLTEGRYPKEGATPVPLGDIADPVSQLILAFMPMLGGIRQKLPEVIPNALERRGFSPDIEGAKLWWKRGGLPPFEESLAQKSSRLASDAGWSENKKWFAIERSARTGNPLPEDIPWTAHDEARRQWNIVHGPSYGPYVGTNPPSNDDVQIELAKIIKDKGWNPSNPGKKVVDLLTGNTVPPASQGSSEVHELLLGQSTPTIEDIIREVILKSQTNWRP